MTAMLTASSLQMGEATLTAEGKSNLATFDIDTLGLESWTKLLTSCPATTPGLPRLPVSRGSATPAFRNSGEGNAQAFVALAGDGDLAKPKKI
jgi:hypothetical protein